MTDSDTAGRVRAVQGDDRTQRSGSPKSGPYNSTTVGRPSPTSNLYDRVNDAARGCVESLCRMYLPDGKRQGRWWIVATPWRVDRHPSLGVSLTTARWQDFATRDRGDMVDLVSRVERIAPHEAALRLARETGLI